MMDTINNFIIKYPQFIASLFVIINGAWLFFTYFNKKSYDKKFEALKHSFNLDLEKRKRMYEMKVTQFEKYYRLIDEFGKRHQVDQLKLFQPIFNDYMENYLKAENNGDKEASIKAITNFSSEIMKIINEGMEQYLSLKSETISLKLISSKEMSEILSELEKGYDDAFNISTELLNKLPELISTNNQIKINEYQGLINKHGEKIKDLASNLMSQMKSELNEI